MIQPEIRIGILGGGQLARMLGEAAEKLGVNIRVYVESSKDPAAQVVDEFVKGSMTNEAELRRFFETVDIVTFENEFVDCDLLERAARDLDLRFIPNLSAVRCLQDKLNQKKLLKRLNILSAESMEVSLTYEEAMRAAKYFGGDAVLKWSRLGYDGKGTFFFNASQQDLAHRKNLEKFFEEAATRAVKVFAEKKIAFVRELAIQSAQSTSGEILHFPLVISKQERGVCRWVQGPATTLGVPKDFELQAQNAMKAIAAALSYHGVLAGEFFQGQDGGLYINELAPRVHNTGHYSLFAATTSQFDAHILAILGENLRKIEAAPFFAMLNLLGPFDLKISKLAKSPDIPDSFSLYWYGKTEIKNGRKMGHLAGSATHLEDFEKLLEKMSEYERNWARRIHHED